MFGPGPALHEHTLTLFTDSYVVRGRLASPGARLTDVLNNAENGLLVIEDATFEEFGGSGGTERAAFAQVNLAAALFATSDEMVEPMPEMRMAKVPQQALISVPPFRIVGRIHLPAVESLREALAELRQAFVPVSDATYWSEALREPRTSSVFLAFNHARAQILAPYAEQDPWSDARMNALSGGGPTSPEVEQA
ncbi:MAG TPA: hypothetical protein VFW92_07965 [Candidatus Limnocylindrales bacterium]|nr:hypothetical protein [Candidatus Limnocylindrales bacterium]